MLEHYINMNNESVALEGDRLIMRRRSFSSSSDFSIEGKDGAVVGQIVGKDSRKPRPFGRFREFEIVDASADVLAYVSKVRVPGARGGYALTRQDGSPLAAQIPRQPSFSLNRLTVCRWSSTPKTFAIDST